MLHLFSYTRFSLGEAKQPSYPSLTNPSHSLSSSSVAFSIRNCSNPFPGSYPIRKISLRPSFHQSTPGEIQPHDNTCGDPPPIACLCLPLVSFICGNAGSSSEDLRKMKSCVGIATDSTSKTRHSIAAESMNWRTCTQRGSHWAAEGARIPHNRPRPGRRRAPFSRTTLQAVLSIAVFFTVICIPALAVAAPAPAAAEAPQLPPVPGNPGFLSRWTPTGDVSDEILFDRSQAPASDLYPELELHKRQTDSGSSSSSSKAKPTTSAAQKNTGASSSAAASSATETASATSTDSGSSGSSTASSASSPLPKPFDGGLGTNFTQQSCPVFLSNMMSNNTFVSCLPFSVLLQVSPYLVQCTVKFPN